MHSFRTISQYDADPHEPTHRSISFEDESAIVTVVTHLRALWTSLPLGLTDVQLKVSSLKPLNDATADIDFGAIAKTENLNEWKTGYVNCPRNPDTTTIDTRLRRFLASMYTHVFYDVARWLIEVNCGVGTYHPPTDLVFSLPFGNDGGGYETDKNKEKEVAALSVTRRQWDCNVLLLPTYLGPGIKVRGIVKKVNPGPINMSDVPDDAPEEEIGVFDWTNPHDIWFVRAHVPLTLLIEGKLHHSKGLAAVMAVGPLWTDESGTEVSDDDKDNDEENGDDKDDDDDEEEDKEEEKQEEEET